MNTSRDAHAAVMDRDASKEIKTNSEDHSQFNDSFNAKTAFADLKAKTLLVFALDANTPEGIAAATGAQLIRLLRADGIRSDQISVAWR